LRSARIGSAAAARSAGPNIAVNATDNSNTNTRADFGHPLARWDRGEREPASIMIRE